MYCDEGQGGDDERDVLDAIAIPTSLIRVSTAADRACRRRTAPDQEKRRKAWTAPALRYTSGVSRGTRSS